MNYDWLQKARLSSLSSGRLPFQWMVWQADIWVEHDPSLEGRPVRELRARSLGLDEELRAAVNDLNRATPAVVFVPLHIKDCGPKIQRAGEFRRQLRIGCGEPNA